MVEYNRVKINRILNPTSIDLGEYVINPFMGCAHACLYCYVRSNRVISRKKKPWGEYVDIRINAPELLEKELKIKKAVTVAGFKHQEVKKLINGRTKVVVQKRLVGTADAVKTGLSGADLVETYGLQDEPDEHEA